MYTAFFNLREMPFSITPDPAYLYLSTRHQEALGHLLYGTGQYGGFVQLTGEVGTGKTTVVRTLLAQKLPEVDVAVILNPRQTEHEFVASVCDELHVPYPSGATTKALVDALNAHLLAIHAAGRRTVVIIDEAQNLAPNVLEQVRLLTNLETHKEKLLRIMLVGQPELAELLARPDLRQLAQRITARFHLTPLAPAETRAYVAHRMRVAGGDAEAFTRPALKLIHQVSGGVPRLINIVCDRALLGAYAQGVRRVTPPIAGKAAGEALGSPARQRRPRMRWWLAAATLAIAVPVAVAWLRAPVLLPQAQHRATAVPPPAPAMATVSAPAPVAVAPDISVKAALQTVLDHPEPLSVVMARLIALWGSDYAVAEGENVCQALSQQKLECYKSSGDWDALGQMNRPAILVLSTGRGRVQHVLLRELGTNSAVIETADGRSRVPLDRLDLLWTGEFLLLWKRDAAQTFIAPNMRGPAVTWLRRKLAQAGGAAVKEPVSSYFDTALANDVRAFQEAHGLDPDGVVGIRTLISLSDLDPGTPTLTPTPTPTKEEKISS